MIYYLADERIKRKLWSMAKRMRNSVHKMRSTKKSMEELNYEGLIAQYGVCDVLGVPFHWGLQGFGDKGTDFYLINGERGQVKFNARRPEVNGELYFRPSQPFIVDYAILAVPSEMGEKVGRDYPNAIRNPFEIIGWITNKEFFEQARTPPWDDKQECLGVTADKLHPFRDFIYFVKSLKLTKQLTLW